MVVKSLIYSRSTYIMLSSIYLCYSNPALKARSTDHLEECVREANSQLLNTMVESEVCLNIIV